jgi:hypothetical protein
VVKDKVDTQDLIKEAKNEKYPMFSYSTHHPSIPSS